ncbi:MAG TPA: diacylglycerol kinase family protein [Gemmatimonadaceae bacterium]|nr:diacylglycerol kinase family protein [Gemmatimonadaceae bacterium]
MPKAFLNAAGGSADAVREALTEAGLDFEAVEPGKLSARLEREIDSGAKRILVAGGDGTVATAAALVAGKDVELAILPGGTLNHFAKDHNIPTDLGEAAKVAVAGVVVGADLGYVNDALFLNTSSLGAYVTFVRVRERFEKYVGYRIASFLALIRTWARLRSFTVTLEVEGEKKTYRSSMVFIGVGERELKLPTLGNRVKNGKRGLHVMVVQGRGRGRLFALALAGIAKGTKEAEKLPEFDDFLVESCRIDVTRSHALIGLDGELKEMRTPLDYRFERDALRVVSSPSEVDE